MSWCYKCTRAYHNAYMKESYHRDPERWKERQRARHIINPANVMLASAKRRAKKFGLELTITLEDIAVPKFCPVFGTPLKVNIGGSQDDSPSLDRIDNTKGYVPGNVWVISKRANDLKQHASLNDLEALVRALRKQMRKRG